MVRRSNHRSSGLQWAHALTLACPLFLAVLWVSLLSGCTSTPPLEPERKVISLSKDVLAGKSVLDVQRVDTDSDGQTEWVVFYRFDQVDERGPVAALIYDVVPDPITHLSMVYPYKLRIPQENYMAQVQPEVALVDVLAQSGGTVRKEVLFRTPEELSFFTLNPSGVNLPKDDPPLYRCVGFFRSRDGVSYDPDSRDVTVTSRAGYERSQLVTRHFYRPEADAYFITNTTTLVTPYRSEVDFPADIPSDILDTPYPEKIVLAFYKTIGRTDPQPGLIEYLSEQAGRELQEGKLKFGSPWPVGELQSAMVKELSYYATGDASQSAVVIVKVVFNRTTGERSALVEVRWTLIRVQNRWKIDYPHS